MTTANELTVHDSRAYDAAILHWQARRTPEAWDAVGEQQALYYAYLAGTYTPDPSPSHTEGPA